MKFIDTNLKGVKVIQPKIFNDSRGFFIESFNSKLMHKAGITENFIQDNHSRSQKNVIRGMHFQEKRPQGKLVRCTYGEIIDVVADIDKSSPTFKEIFQVKLTEKNFKLIWIPPGYAHGFIVLSDYAEVQYKCTNFYDPEDQQGIIWNDKDLNINWMIDKPILSKKDCNHPTLEKYFSDK